MVPSSIRESSGKQWHSNVLITVKHVKKKKNKTNTKSLDYQTEKHFLCRNFKDMPLGADSMTQFVKVLQCAQHLLLRAVLQAKHR